MAVLQNNVNEYLAAAPGGLCLLTVNYPRANVNGGASGNNDTYTVPAGLRAIVLTSTYRSQSGSSATVVPNWKISGTYYPVNFSTQTVGAGALVNDTVDGGMILEAGESISFNSTQASLNFFCQLVQFSNQSNLRTVKTIGATNGDQTVYTCPAGKHAILMNGNGQPKGSPNFGSFISNSSGGSITSNIYFIPNGGSKGANNLLLASAVTTTGSCTRIPICGIMNPGDFLLWNCNTTNANALCAFTVLEV
jgi:hypothetical protein